MRGTAVVRRLNPKGVAGREDLSRFLFTLENYFAKTVGKKDIFRYFCGCKELSFLVNRFFSLLLMIGTTHGL